MGIGSVIVLIFTFTAASLFFSVSTIALRIFSRVKLQESLKKRNKERLLDAIVDNSEKLILTCATFSLIFNMGILLLLLGLFETARPNGLRIANYTLAFIAALLIFSIFSLAVPHAWAKYAGEKILSRTYRALALFATIAWPVLYVLKCYDEFIRRLAGVPETTPDQRQEEKQEEFLNGLEQRRLEGVVDAEEQQMIEGVLELSETTAGEIMTPRTDLIAVDINSDRGEVLDIVTSAGHSRVPVYEENVDNIIGLVYAKDLLSEIGRGPADFKLRNKIRQTYFVPETKSLRELLHEFQNQKLHIAVVLDEYGGTAGIVTLEDIIEELVGEITDEYEKKPPEPIVKIGENTFEIDARTYIDDLNDKLDINLPEEEDYDTIAGFVFSHLGYIPKPGETFDYENLRFTISSAEPRRINRIKIRMVGDKAAKE